MTNRSKAKGSSAEVAVRDFLRAAGWLHAERLPTEGAKDRGDIVGVDPKNVIEVKACKQMDLAGWLAEVEVEKANADAEIGVVWHKKRGTTDPGRWYVTMSGEDYVQLLRAWTGRPFAVPSCESCGAPGAVIGGGAWWCKECDEAAARLGYDDGDAA